MPDFPLEGERAAATAADEVGRRFDVFLSHSSRDKPLVERIAERLKQARLEPWLDSWQLVPGVDWQRGLAQGLAASRSCAVFVGPGDLGAWENEEVAVALDRAVSDPEFRLFLVLLPGLGERFDAAELKPFLRMRTWVDYRGGLDDERALQALVRAIQGLTLGPAAPLELDTDVCPYRGLEVFEEEHADFFFGRDADVQRLLEKLKGRRFLAVLGASGSGKSSLVRAGLMPALRHGALFGADCCQMALLRPGAHPLEGLAGQLLRLRADGAMQQTLDALAGDERTFHLTVSLALFEQPPELPLVLIVDQFEEVFTLCRDEKERSAFLANLLYAATIPGGRCRVLLTLRADFYHRGGAYPELAQQLAAEQYLVSPLQPEGLRQAIEEPARRVGLAFEPGLVATILQDVAGQPGALPLLEHALLEIWRRRSGGILALAAYRESGGVQGAIAARAEDVFESLEPNQQQLARRTFLRLTQPGEGTEDTRRRVHLAELEGGDGDADIAAVLARLVNARLVTTSRDQARGGEVVEVAHEALIRGWPRLQTWVDEDRTGLRVHRRLTEAAREWERHAHDEGSLYRGMRLVEALEWSTATEGSLNTLEREFLGRSEEVQQRERSTVRRRARVTIGGLLVALAAIGAVAVVAILQRQDAIQQRKEAVSRELAADAVAGLGDDPVRSLGLATAAASSSMTGDAEDALRRALNAVLARAVLRGHTGPVTGLAFSPTGAQIVTAGEDGTARVWDTVSGREIMVLRGHGAGVALAVFSPDGKRVVTVDAQGSARQWEAGAGRLVRVLSARSGLTAAAVSPDGRFVATAGYDDTLRICDMEAGRAVSVVRGPDLMSLDFSPDGTLLAGGTTSGAVVLWEVPTARRVRILHGHGDWVVGVSFSRDGQRLVSASNDDTARVWDARSGRRLAILRHDSWVNSALFSPDSKLIVTASEDGTARVWNAADGESVAQLRPDAGALRSASFSPDGRLVVAVASYRPPQVWDVLTGTRASFPRGHSSTVNGAAFSPDGRLVATAGADRTARLWSPSAQSAVVFGGSERSVAAADVSPDGRRVVTGFEDGTAQIWAAAGGHALVLLKGHRERLDSAEFSPDGRLVLTRAEDSTVRVWRASDGKPLAILRTGSNLSDHINDAALSRDSDQVVTASSDNIARIWAPETGARLAVLRGHSGPVYSASFSADGKLVVTTSDDSTARVWDASSGRVVSVLRGHREGSVFHAEFSHDGKFVVTAGADKTARVWEAHAGRLVAILRGHTDRVQFATFSPDGQLVLTASDDGTARLWNAHSGRLVATLLGHTRRLTAARFSPDGRLAITEGYDGARLWEVAPVRELTRLGESDAIDRAAFGANGTTLLTVGSGIARLYACDSCLPPMKLHTLARLRLARILTRPQLREYVDNR